MTPFDLNGVVRIICMIASHFDHECRFLCLQSKLDIAIDGMQELEAFDISQVVKTERENRRVKKDLTECQHEHKATPLPPTPHPRTYTLATLLLQPNWMHQQKHTLSYL